MIPEDIKAIRLKLLLTQEEMAEKVGVTSFTIHRWETGKGNPSLKHLRKLRALARNS
mgnify:CR=1 FL=1